MEHSAFWYCLYAKPNNTGIVQKNLEFAGVESFSPLYRKKVIKGGKRFYKKKELFPNYLFVRCFEAQFHMIKYTRGVSKFISDGSGNPYQIDEGLISTIKERMNNGFVDINPLSLRPGEKVKVVDGTFKNFEGIFIEEKTPNERVILLLSTITSQMKVEMEMDNIKPLSKAVV